ncbi:ABC transporter ATP-binding protein [Paucilactobacillus kaifaensis]|uniref:ABC transporter ATP-binding protein n=1 Tax=Paucilactobacillus kaifaensis TaxID=2559921 RepID=UPI0010F7E913|nr:ABC transporter ATP-binding protein [Paucilactobacillus kaifaensis]
MDEVVKMNHITKRFGEFKANDDISMTLHYGEILALLGENGAGKSTIMNILSGLLQPTDGTIEINGVVTQLAGPRQAKELGIGMVHQHFMLIPAFTVLENIILGDEPTKRGRIDYQHARATVEALVEKYQLKLELDAKVANISVGMQQRVEIVKALYRQATILIFDEPTAALTPQEVQEIIVIFKQLAREGKSIVFITHKLGEIKQIADNCVVIRAGQVVKTLPVDQVSENKLAELMVGHPMNGQLVRQLNEQQHPVLTVHNLTVKTNHQLKVNQLSLSVNTGEIVGIAGVDGNGQSELINAISGLTKIQTGEIKIADQNVTHQAPRRINEAGLGVIPEDRQNTGLILALTLAENLALKSYYQQQYNWHGLLNYTAINQTAQRLISSFDIRSQSEKETATELSGGNQQKLVVAREISNEPKVLIAANPTRGVDVGAIEYIHQQLIEQRNKGCGILLVSFELDEILKLSDRVLVMHGGEIVGEIDPQNTTSQELGLLMAGKKQNVGG